MKLALTYLVAACLCTSARGIIQDFRLTPLDDLKWELYLDDIDSSVDGIDIDRFVPGNILYSSGAALWTTDGQTTSRIVGGKQGTSYDEGVGEDAAFNRCICGFYQLDTTHVILADIFNHCYRIVDRTTNQTSDYIGACTQRGNQDGVSAELSLPSPDIRRDYRDPTKLLFTDQNLLGPLTFKLFDSSTRVTSTSYTTRPQSTELGLIFTQDPLTGDIYFDPTPESAPISGSCSIGRFSFVTQEVTCATTEPFKFIRHLQLSNSGDKLLFLDNGEPTVFELSSKVSTPLCRGQRDQISSLCSEGPFTAIRVVGDILYLGTQSKIFKAQEARCSCTVDGNTYTPILSDNCRSFYQAADHSPSHTAVLDCPSDLVFDYKECACQWDWLAYCPQTC